MDLSIHWRVTGVKLSYRLYRLIMEFGNVKFRSIRIVINRCILERQTDNSQNIYTFTQFELFFSLFQNQIKLVFIRLHGCYLTNHNFGDDSLLPPLRLLVSCIFLQSMTNRTRDLNLIKTSHSRTKFKK